MASSISAVVNKSPGAFGEDVLEWKGGGGRKEG